MSASATLTPRAQARREQVLKAAAQCFTRRGFHAASMSEIAKTSGLSAGHIYNLFENKDDIIAAIVERDCIEVVERISALQQEGQVLERLLAETEKAISDSGQGCEAALEFEILAEASRNPRLAAVVQRSQTLMHDKAVEMLRMGLGPRAAELPEAELHGRALMLGVLFSGLSALAVRQPELTGYRLSIAPVMQRLMKALFEA